MLNPLRHLTGKLNHFHIPQAQCMKIIAIANSIPLNQSSSSLPSTQQILTLKSNHSQINPRKYQKFLLQNQVHSHSNTFILPSTIYDDLNPTQKKLVKLYSQFTDKLNTRQLLYLNYAIRKKLENKVANWQTLHISPESPARVDLQVLPTLQSLSKVAQLMNLPKKIVMKAAILAKGT